MIENTLQIVATMDVAWLKRNEGEDLTLEERQPHMIDGARAWMSVVSSASARVYPIEAGDLAICRIAAEEVMFIRG